MLILRKNGMIHPLTENPQNDPPTQGRRHPEPMQMKPPPRASRPTPSAWFDSLELPIVLMVTSILALVAVYGVHRMVVPVSWYVWVGSAVGAPLLFLVVLSVLTGRRNAGK